MIGSFDCVQKTEDYNDQRHDRQAVTNHCGHSLITIEIARLLLFTLIVDDNDVPGLPYRTYAGVTTIQATAVHLLKKIGHYCSQANKP